MLKSLDKYIEDQTSGKRFRDGRDGRFIVLLVLSIIVHVIFYATLIKLSTWAMQQKMARRERQVELVKVAEIAPPADRSTLRSAVEPIERADISRMEFDPEHSDDVHLVPRSPKLGTPRGTAPSPQPPRSSAIRPPSQPAPPVTAPIQAPRASSQMAPLISQVPLPQAVPAPPAPSQNKDAGVPPAGVQESAERTTPREASSGTRDFGLQAVQSQYLAYVRAKIRETNERIMPREWIKDILREKVSADFEVRLGRGGQILSARLDRSTGYSVLDSVARQAIYNARPFEGYPQSAGDTIILTVTIYYSPLW